MKFLIFVEGQTEKDGIKDFIKKWLDGQLKQKVGVDLIKIPGFPCFKKDLQKKVKMHLGGARKNEIIAAIGLLDLYTGQEKSFYSSDCTTADQRYSWGKEFFEKQVNHPQFRMFFAVHEIEAWLLSQPDIFPQDVQSDLAKKSDHPETVNFQNPPSVFLENLYRTRLKRTYKKSVDGPNLFKKLNPEIAYPCCPYFRSLLDEMLRLAKEFES